MQRYQMSNMSCTERVLIINVNLLNVNVINVNVINVIVLNVNVKNIFLLVETCLKQFYKDSGDKILR